MGHRFIGREVQDLPGASAACKEDLSIRRVEGVKRNPAVRERLVFQDELGPAGQFGSGLPKFAPGSKLMIRKADGSLVTLVDGSNHTPATGNLIDVQSPDVSFDGAKTWDRNRVFQQGKLWLDAGAGLRFETPTDSFNLAYGRSLREGKNIIFAYYERRLWRN